jgi:hypothetical protein
MRTWVKQAGRSPSLISLMVQQTPHAASLASVHGRSEKTTEFFRSHFQECRAKACTLHNRKKGLKQFVFYLS